MPVDLRKLVPGAGAPTVVAVPLGSIEQHCRMPLGLDCLIAEKLAWRACELAESKAGFTCVIAPPLCYGFSPEWKGMPGTVSLSLKAFEDVIKSITLSLWEWGVERVVYINGHGGNSPALRAILAETTLLAKAGRLVALIDYWRVAGLDIGHASRVEAEIARSLGIEVNEGDAGCQQAALAGGGVHIYTPSGQGLEALDAKLDKVDVSQLINRMADAIIEVVNADASRHWIG